MTVVKRRPLKRLSHGEHANREAPPSLLPSDGADRCARSARIRAVARRNSSAEAI